MSESILTLSQSISYQPGSVVSKEIHRKKTGTVTLFAFDAGQGLSEHTAPFDAVVQVLDGEAEIYIDRELHKVGVGQLIIMPAGIPHSLHAAIPFKMLLTMIRSQGNV